MCKTHLAKGWGTLIAVLLFIGAATTTLAASHDGVTLEVYGVPFNTFVTQLVNEHGGKKLVLTENVTDDVTFVAKQAMPVEKILGLVSKQHGLDFWQDEDTYYIGKRAQSTSPSNTVKAQPTLDTVLPSPVKGEVGLPSLTDFSNKTTSISVPDQAEKQKQKYYRGSIQLENTSASEIAWILGFPGTKKPSVDRRKILDQRIQLMLDPRRPTTNGGENYTSPMLNSSPWMSGSVNNRNSMSDGYQVFGNTGTTGNPYTSTGIGNTTTDTGNYNPVNNYSDNTSSSSSDSDFGGLLENFIPDGIDDVVGIESLNTLLVRSTRPEAIDELANFIKLLDRPTKQAVIEVMYVRMSVDDALMLSSTWNVDGSPWSAGFVGSNSGGFSARYMRGNIRLSLSALITSTRAKVVNAPRIIVQNGASGAFILFTQSIPFVLTAESEDLYGRTTAVPTIGLQGFSQGMIVNEVLIHPDNSVTLQVSPQLEDPTDAIPLPGAENSGSISGTQNQTIQTRVRVKNGETIMMGGFVSNVDKASNTKIPLLGDLPIIGQLLFKSTSNETLNSQTMFFITPTVIEDDKTNFDGMTTLPPLF